MIDEENRQNQNRWLKRKIINGDQTKWKASSIWSFVHEMNVGPLGSLDVQNIPSMNVAEM